MAHKVEASFIITQHQSFAKMPRSAVLFVIPFGALPLFTNSTMMRCPVPHRLGCTGELWLKLPMSHVS